MMNDKRQEVDYTPLNTQDLILCKALMDEMRESRPEQHKRVSVHWHNILKDIEPGSRRGPPINEFILSIVDSYAKD
jgi:hypothetical protein